MNKKVYHYKRILKYALLAICTMIAFFLAYYNSCYSIRQKKVPYGLTLLETRDSLALHLITAAVFLIIVMAVRGGSQDADRKKGLSFFLGAVMLCALLCCFIWVTAGNFYAQNDSRRVLECMEHIRNGDYSDFRPNGYLGIYKQHFGLITLFRFLFFMAGTTNDIAIQFFNCLCVPVIIYAGIQVLRELNATKGSFRIYLVFMAFCLPLFLYTPYVYGEIISVTAGMLFTWAALCYIKREKTGAWAVMAVSAVIGNMARGNFPILLIAFGIIAFLYSVRRKKLKLLLCAFSLFAVVILADKVNLAYYEKLSGIVLGQGLPLEACIAMGMDEYGELGYGTYNGYEVELYAKCEYDPELTRSAARNFIRDRMRMFLAGTGMPAKDFYKGKILLQWNDPTLNCFMENQACIPQPHHLVTDIVLEDGKYAETVKELLNQYQFLLYTGFLFYCVSLWGMRTDSFYQYLPLIIILGGFLFTLFWEAMSRYVFPYVIYMIPLAAGGWNCAGEQIGRIIKILGDKQTGKGNKK